MARRAKGHVPAAAAVVAAALVAGAIAPPVRAQPVVPTADEIAEAKRLYEAAEADVQAGRFDDAARDYGASYELSRDGALLFKIGRANERAGRCAVALMYYGRYLREGQPTPEFVATTKERIAACGGDPGQYAVPEPADQAGSAGSAGSAAPNGSAGSARVGSAGSAAPLVLVPSNRHKVAWVLTGGAAALVTLGGVLAYAANSSENDVRDLYVGIGNRPTVFDAETRKRYDDLVAQGRRYEHLSWAAFGLAGAAALGATFLFVTGRRDGEQPRVAPVLTGGTAGVSVRF